MDKIISILFMSFVVIGGWYIGASISPESIWWLTGLVFGVFIVGLPTCLLIVTTNNNRQNAYKYVIEEQQKPPERQKEIATQLDVRDQILRLQTVVQKRIEG